MKLFCITYLKFVSRVVTLLVNSGKEIMEYVMTVLDSSKKAADRDYVKFSFSLFFLIKKCHFISSKYYLSNADHFA